jgi:transposase
VLHKLNSAATLIQRTTTEAPRDHMYYIGLDVHKRTISYCVKDAAGQVHQEGKIGSTRCELDAWIKTVPQPRMIAMEATIFTGWIYDHLLRHAETIKVAHPLMLRTIAAAKKKNDKIDAAKIADCLRCDFLPECHMASTAIRDRRRTLRYRAHHNSACGHLVATGQSNGNPFSPLCLSRCPALLLAWCPWRLLIIYLARSIAALLSHVHLSGPEYACT